MDAGNNSGRFYSSSSSTSSTQQLSAASPAAQIRHDGSGSDSVSDHDTSASRQIHLAQRPELGYDVPRGAFWDQTAHPHAHSRALARAATVDVAVGPYAPTGLDAARQVPVFAPTGFDGRFDGPVHPAHAYGAPFPPPPSSTTPYTVRPYTLI